MRLDSRIAFIVVAGSLTLGAAAHAQQAAYNAVPTPLPPNVPSLGFEATSTDEFGDHVALSGPYRKLWSVDVLMSSWACEGGAWYNGCVTTSGATFTHDVTLNIYAVDHTLPTPAVGALIASKTQTFVMPFRPSTSAACAPGTGWEASPGQCYNGLAFTITFDLLSLDITLPDEVIYGVAYNTSHHGATPIGVGGPYDSLNVGLNTAGPIPGDVEPDALFWDTSHGPFYCDGGAEGVDVFRRDTCWSPYVPAAKINVLPVPLNANQCKKNGWMGLYRLDGSPFKNQGDCMQYLKAGK